MINHLEELRKQRGIRQEDLAQALGVSRQTVISLEKGKYNPSLSLAFKLARYFGLSIEDIFDDSDEYADEKWLRQFNFCPSPGHVFGIGCQGG